MKIAILDYQNAKVIVRTIAKEDEALDGDEIFEKVCESEDLQSSDCYYLISELENESFLDIK